MKHEVDDHADRIEDPHVSVADDRHESIVHASIAPAQVRGRVEELCLPPVASARELLG